MLDTNEVIRIRDWDKHYENNRSRILQKMIWLPIPNRLDNEGYIELVMHPNGPAHFGAWVALLQVASRSHPRGVLIRDNRQAHNPESLARITRMPSEVITDAIGRLQGIGWLEVVPIDIATAPRCQEGAAPSDGQPGSIGRKEKRKEGTHRTAAPQYFDISTITGKRTE